MSKVAGGHISADSAHEIHCLQQDGTKCWIPATNTSGTQVTIGHADSTSVVRRPRPRPYLPGKTFAASPLSQL